MYCHFDTPCFNYHSVDIKLIGPYNDNCHKKIVCRSTKDQAGKNQTTEAKSHPYIVMRV
jgi:hypothetical protein